MNAEQLAHFRQKLLATQADLERERAAVDTLALSADSSVGDQADQSVADTEREFSTINHERIQMLLAQVHQALASIDNGTFGVCVDTGRPIGLKRLEAQPTATLSIEAQEARERERR